MLLERSRLPSSISCKSCALGVALSRLYRTGLTSVEIGGRVGWLGGFITKISSASAIDCSGMLVEVAPTLLKVEDGWLAPSPLGDDLSVEVIDLAEGSLDAYVYI